MKLLLQIMILPLVLPLAFLLLVYKAADNLAASVLGTWQD